MNFNIHSNLKDQHAFLSGSKPHWINYDAEKLVSTYSKYQATIKGTELHDFAKRCIELNIKLPKIKRALNSYVNDAIGYRMTPELTLYFTDNAFGTADALCFRDNFLRIHDLKTGVSPVSMRQLEVYEALFCLEYNFSPFKIQSELRLYQLDTIVVHNPDPKDISKIMNTIIEFDKIIDKLKTQPEG